MKFFSRYSVLFGPGPELRVGAILKPDHAKSKKVLQDLKKQFQVNGVKKLGMPRIEFGLDPLSWRTVHSIFK